MKKKRFITGPTLLILGQLTYLVSAAAAGDGCNTIIEATVAEMQAAAGNAWDEEQRRLARSAAASACVKAQSGHYDAVISSAVKPTATDQPSAQSSQATGETDASKTDVLGIGFRPLSGSPSKKPFERSRATDD